MHDDRAGLPRSGGSINASAADPELVALAGTWTQAYNDNLLGDESASDAQVAGDAAQVAAWCGAHGLGWAASS